MHASFLGDICIVTEGWEGTAWKKALKIQSRARRKYYLMQHEEIQRFFLNEIANKYGHNHLKPCILCVNIVYKRPHNTLNSFLTSSKVAPSISFIFV